MMDLTPLDVRKKKGDFRRGLRGYESAQVDDFLDLAADRMEALVKEASTARERISRLEQQVADYRDREKALTEALVTAQQMREDIRTQSTREVELLKKEAEQEADGIRADAVRMRQREEQALDGLRARQFQFIASYRKYLEQELAELGATMQGLQMHSGGAGRVAGSTSSYVPAAPVAEAAQSFRPAAPAATGPVATTAAAAPAVPVQPPVPAGPSEASPPGATPAVPEATGPAAVPVEPDEPLEDALARWEPELEAGTAPAAHEGATAEAGELVLDDESGEAASDTATGSSFDEDDSPNAGEAVDLVLEAVEPEEHDDLLLSAEEVLAEDRAAGPAAGLEVESGEELDFLELGEDDIDTSDVLSEEDRRTRDREVSAAMVELDDSFIDLEAALHEETDDLVARAGAPMVPERDETDDMIDAAFDFGEDDDPVVEIPVREAAGADPAEEASQATGQDLRNDIEFVDALLLDAETAFNEEPLEVPSEEPAADVTGRAEDSGAASDVDAAFGDDSGLGGPDGEEAESGADLIDLDSFRGGISNYTPPASPTSDVSSLTLHPMFFEKDSAKKDSEEHEETRHDH